MLASSSTQRPTLSTHTTRTDRSNSLPTKSSQPMYDLPLDTPKSSRPKARPGGLAGEGFLVTNGLGIPDRRRSNDRPLIRGYGTVQGPDQASLSLFAQHCRAFYIGGSSESGDYISHMISSSHAHRSIYTKLQATLRAWAHLHHLKIRISSFHALISSMTASGSLSMASRSMLSGRGAQRERREGLSQFVTTWDGAGMEPFLKGLHAIFVLSPIARDRRVVWEIDDAVFLESGGLEFMQSAVTLLKGVLGFEDTPLTLPPRLKRIRTLPPASARTKRLSPGPTPRQSSRPLAPLPPDVDHEDEEDIADNDVIAEDADLNRPRFRLWTFPSHISDEEAFSLQRLFTRSVRPVTRFPFIPPGHGPEFAMISEDWEEALPGVRVPRPSTEALEGVVRLGTGRAWIGLDSKDRGFQGSAWFRFKQWWRRLFGLA